MGGKRNGGGKGEGVANSMKKCCFCIVIESSL